MLNGFRQKVVRAINRLGREVLDPTPVAIPAGFKRPETLEEQIRRLIRNHEVAKALSGSDQAGSFEDEDDFDIPDDPVDPATPYEEQFDPVLGRGVTPYEILTEREKLNAATEKAVDKRRKSRAKEERPAELADASPPKPPAEPGHST